MRRTNRIILTVVVIIIILSGFGFANRGMLRRLFTRPEQIPVAVPLTDIVMPVPTTTSSVITSTTTPRPLEPIPAPVSISKSEINLAVPFASQAPLGDWSARYNEACEEASIIMVDHYLRGALLSKQEMKDLIDRQVMWQEEQWGGHHDLSVEKTIRLAKQFYPSYTYTIISDLTASKIREQLLLGRPVIVPAAGRELHNPNFKVPGPIYHMLVVKGFTKDGKFITNDPGTRNGADYIYTESILMNAIHDWTGEAADGEKVGLVIF